MGETWKPYQPSNGMEGMWFMSQFCDQCKRDAAFRDGTGDSCPIAADTMVFKVTDPGYPKEWLERHTSAGDEVKCTAFEPDGAPPLSPEAVRESSPGLITKDSTL